MNNQTIQKTIHTLIFESKSAIIDFQEELLQINHALKNNEEEKELLLSMCDDIVFINGTLLTNCFHLEKLLENLEKQQHYYLENQNSIELLLKKISDFNSLYLTKKR